MSFLQFAVWGTYLTSLGSYLVSVGLGGRIGLFYAMQGIASLFMPALMGIIADRLIPAERLLGLCHFISAVSMALAGFYGMTQGADVAFGPLFTLYALGVGFYMPTLALSNSVAYAALEKTGLDPVSTFPSIRIFGTVGFICSMWAVDLLGLQKGYGQFFVYAIVGVVYALYALTLPHCPVNRGKASKSLVDALGIRAFTLFKERQMAVFFLFCFLLGISLQITNGFANPFISSFGSDAAYAGTFGVRHANILISLSQISETFCILLIPFFLKRFGIKRVILIAMTAWVLRFALFGAGNPGGGVWMFILSMIVYGVAFDFFNISGSLFVNRQTDKSIRSSAQGLFVLMTNGLGATIGTLSAQAVVSRFTHPLKVGDIFYTVGDWSSVWYIFAAFALITGILFAWLFKYDFQPYKLSRTSE
ncbi:MAG: MFS transporter [Prevotellaceae bacterium]|nr:MFS transporter [Prevotellaceae bacterium]